jgi:small ligand-binding sensory domain FIST
VGTQLVPVYRDEDHIFNGVDRMMQRMQGQLSDRRPLAVFQADCMARGRMTHDACSKDEIIANIQNPIFGSGTVPWLGIYGFAEYAMLAGRNRFHHYTTSLSAIVRKA